MKVKKNLAEFNMSMSQLLSITTDNGKNLLKAVADFDAEYQTSKSTESACAANINDSDFIIDDDVFDEDYYMDLLSSMRSQFDDALYSDLIHGVSCGAHVLQLVVNGGLDRCATARTTIDQARHLIIRLRTPRKLLVPTS